ncbi:conserved hypothetical protein [Mesorhizobium plurifarium]|uniref:Uncharacterized protein n=1 Tax=Mesorhizobium plurifarium TaxID=69974 RepID=A0A090DVG1_MESPL|nr:conserved hypothetical protein [Mesorhizobium plurifarium]
MCITAAAQVDLAVLVALAELLRDTGVPSQSQMIGAASDSHESNRREVRAAKAHDHQFDLFSRLHDTDTMMAPQCQALPVQTRRSVTKLMVCLILDHVGGYRAGRQEDAGHDA